MFENSRRGRRLRVEILPMIDIMFYLVLFFMVFGTFRTETAGMPLELPRAATAKDLREQHLVVGVDAEGRIYFDDRILSDEDLTRILVPRLRAEADRLVIVKADKSVRYERLIQTIDAIRKAGGAHLALAVERAPQAGGGGQ
ncbi:MAG: biopolymer transporter ExbD [Clostridia bacterium]|nr:biopolymer transporter ExbD [Clostridia bacterium]